MQHNQGFLDLVNDAKQNITECTIANVKQWIDNNDDFILMDVREQSEWAAGHLPGAVYLGKGLIECKIESVIPERDKKIVLYCGGGFRSALAAQSIQKMGYTNVISMDGGFRGWREARLPTTSN